MSIGDGLQPKGGQIGWRKSRYSAAGAGAACVQASVSTLWQDEMITLGTQRRQLPGAPDGPTVLRPATKPGPPVAAEVPEATDHDAPGVDSTAAVPLWRGESVARRTRQPLSETAAAPQAASAAVVGAVGGWGSDALERMAEAAAVSAQLAADEEQVCLMLIREFQRLLYPDGAAGRGRPGVRSGRAVDDASVVADAAGLRYLDLPREDWGPVDSWETLTGSLAKASGPGGPAAACVVTSRPGSKGHAFTLVRTTDGAVWIADPHAAATGGRLREATAEALDTIGSPITARALTLDAHGRAIPPQTLIPSRQSRSTFWSITDPADPRIGSDRGPAANTGNHAVPHSRQWLEIIRRERSGTSPRRSDWETLQQIDNALADWLMNAGRYAQDPMSEMRNLVVIRDAIAAYQRSYPNSPNSQSVSLLSADIQRKAAAVDGRVRAGLQQIDSDVTPFAERMPDSHQIYANPQVAQLLTAGRTQAGKLTPDAANV